MNLAGLSSLQSLVSPDAGAQLTKGAQGAGKPGGIPFPELEDLKYSLAPKGATAPDSAGSTQIAGGAPSLDRIQTGGNFQNLLGDFVREVNQKQAIAGDAIEGLMSGKNVSLHQAMISMEEASVSFQMMVEVRNKLLDSYQELMRMQV